jgi:LmbE family N-acetylglucosaminyl deacetylase
MTLEQKLQAGSAPLSGTTILHTAPHHDDILLGYFPYAVRNLANNSNHVLYLTSGANGVSDQFCARYHGMSIEQFNQLDTPTKIDLKSRIRELESEKKWTIVGQNSLVQIKHLRAEFYLSAESLLKQSVSEHKNINQQDVARVIDYLKQVKPDIITVLVDEQGCGPQTHHQAAELMFAAIAEYRLWLQAQGRSDELIILGYRNIWSSFTPDQASLIVPVSQQDLDLVEAIFEQCFISQCQNFIFQDEGRWINFGQQATSIFREQGALVGIDQAAVFLQKL